MKKIIFIFAFILNIVASRSQSTVYFPKVGETVIDHSFNDVINNEKSNISIKDYRGQWLVLDFWSRFCSGCIASFPRMDSLSKQFEGRVKIVMVAACEEDTNDMFQTKKLYSKQAKMNKLSFTVAFDSTARGVFDITGFPLILIIDPAGKIVVKTYHLDSAALTSIINGNIPNYVPKAYSTHEKRPDADYNMDIPLLTNGKLANGNIDTSFLYRSLLTKWNEKMPAYLRSGFFKDNGGEADTRVSECTGVDLQDLLYFVHTGRLDWYPDYGFQGGLVLNSTKLSIKDFYRNGDENQYSYSLITPEGKGSLQKSQKALSIALERTFGITSTVEVRPCKVLALVIKDSEKIKSLKNQDGIDSWKNTGDQLIIKNISVQKFIREYLQLTTKIALYDLGLPPTLIVDKTGLNYNLDLVFSFKYLNFKQIISELNRLGFDLVEQQKPLKVIVVSDIE